MSRFSQLRKPLCVGRFGSIIGPAWPARFWPRWDWSLVAHAVCVGGQPGPGHRALADADDGLRATGRSSKDRRRKCRRTSARDRSTPAAIATRTRRSRCSCKPSYALGTPLQAGAARAHLRRGRAHVARHAERPALLSLRSVGLAGGRQPPHVRALEDPDRRRGPHDLAALLREPLSSTCCSASASGRT